MEERSRRKITREDMEHIRYVLNADNVLNAMRELDCNYDQLGKYVGIDRGTANAIVNGRRSINHDLYLRIRRALPLTEEELVADTFYSSRATRSAKPAKEETGDIPSEQEEKIVNVEVKEQRGTETKKVVKEMDLIKIVFDAEIPDEKKKKLILVLCGE